MNRSVLLASGGQLLRQADTLCKLYPDRELMRAVVITGVPAATWSGDPIDDAVRSALVRLSGTMRGVRDGGVRDLETLREHVCDVRRLIEQINGATGSGRPCTCLRCRA